MWTIFDFFVLSIGFAACWFLKDRILEFVSGAETYARSLESKAAALKAKI